MTLGEIRGFFLSLDDMTQDDIGQEMTNARNALLEALRNEPSKYWIEVIDPDPLPEKLKEKKKIAFTIKPPTLATLTQLAQVTERIPNEVFEDMNMSKEALRHIPDIVEMIAIMAHGSTKKPMPDWYVPFLQENLTIAEVLQLWFEVSAKIQTSFFLPFIQSVKAMNPMTMMSPDDLILSRLSEGV